MDSPRRWTVAEGIRVARSVEGPLMEGCGNDGGERRVCFTCYDSAFYFAQGSLIRVNGLAVQARSGFGMTRYGSSE